MIKLILKKYSLQLGLFKPNYRRAAGVISVYFDFQDIHKLLLFRMPKSYLLTYLVQFHALCPLYFGLFTISNVPLCKCYN